MFYLVITNLGNDQCIAQSISNNFTDRMAIDCTQDLGFPAGAQLVKNITVICNGDINATNARIFKK